MIIYFSSRTHPGYWLLDPDGTGDFGGTFKPTEATQFKTKRECNRVVAKCAKAWHADVEQFHIFKQV
ncbi:hypothetical protein PJWF_00060 [Achromobacter phage JWF]|uniref:hypothetical protein n=1 Tax=Achromobacter phage JWF TaxID=1589748 RepID=UPI000588E597|nr:hypothetical protein AXJ13_gp060 [Achromobacter phage JWF]AJD82954.1 hypothetical protein PJWF_00060 [Achromobacter phage JWF]